MANSDSMLTCILAYIAGAATIISVLLLFAIGGYWEILNNRIRKNKLTTYQAQKKINNALALGAALLTVIWVSVSVAIVVLVTQSGKL